MEAQDDLNRLAPGRKVVLHYTPSHLTPPHSDLADRDHLSSEDVPLRSAPSNPETETKFQHPMLNGHAKSLSQDPRRAPQGFPESTCPPIVAINEATEPGGAQNPFRDAGRGGRMEINESRLRRPCKSLLIGTPKYTATVIDALPQLDGAFKHISTVFIVPQGMELDLLVSTPEGQAQVVAGADAARVFVVTLNRGHAFSSAEQVQKELSPWIRTLTPTNGLPPTLDPTSIPYTTTSQGIGHRTVLIETWSQINGTIVVEDVRLIEPGRLQPTTFRRMFFLNSPGLIQSEAVLIHTEPGESTGQSGPDLAYEHFDDRGEFSGDGPGVSGSVPGTNTDGCNGSGGNAAAGERLERDHRKKIRMKGVPSSRGTEEAETRTGAPKGASGEELGVESERERDHWKRARRRLGGSPGSSGTGEEMQGFEPNSGSGFSGDFSSLSGRSTSQQSGERLATGAEAESRGDAACPEDADGVNKGEGASDRGKRQASRTANANGEFSGATRTGLAAKHCNGAVETLGETGLKRRGLAGVDFSYLASDYLQAMVAGLAFLGPVIEERTRTETGGLLDVLIIGLGGGGMPMFLRRHLPFRVEVIEIDPTVVELATTFFGVSQDPALQVHIADAIPWAIAAAAAEVSSSKSRKGSFDAVLIDVESAGGQCPPPAFLEPRFLTSLRALLRSNGVFAMNVVAPDETREATNRAVRSCLGNRLYEWSVPQNSNRVLFSHRTSELPDVSQTSADRTAVATGGEVLTRAGVGHVSSYRTGERVNEDAVDLVYWASRLAEKGAGMTAWARGPDLPSLMGDVRIL